MDERLLTREKCKIMLNSKYDGDYIFAFDNIKDYDLIHEKLKMIREYSCTKRIKFYVLCGFESTDSIDISNTFKRIELLMQYDCLPYIMRFQNKNETPWKDSEMRGMYITLARWCNQPNFFRRKSFREFCHMVGNEAALRYSTDFEEKYPEIAAKYYDMKMKF